MKGAGSGRGGGGSGSGLGLGLGFRLELLMMIAVVERQRDILVSSENYPQSNGSASFFYQEAWSDHSTLYSNLEKVYNCGFLSCLAKGFAGQKIEQNRLRTWIPGRYCEMIR